MTAFAADPALLNLVMPDAQIIAGVNVTTAEISPFGQFVLSRIGSNDPGLQAFIAQTGFDPRQDVTEILAASNANTASPGGLLLVKGTFNPAQIVAAVAGHANQQVSTYAGAPLITGTEAKTPHALAFVGSSIAVAGDLASVKAALDRNSATNSIDPALATQVQSLSETEDAWSVSMAALAALVPAGVAAPGIGGAVLQLGTKIVSSSGGIKFGANVQVTAQAIADNAQDAGSIADLVRMLAGIASMGAAQNPQAATVAQLLQGLQVTTSGTAVNIAASVPETQLEALLHPAAAARPAVRNRRL